MFLCRTRDFVCRVLRTWEKSIERGNLSTGDILLLVHLRLPGILSWKRRRELTARRWQKWMSTGKGVREVTNEGEREIDERISPTWEREEKRGISESSIDRRDTKASLKSSQRTRQTSLSKRVIEVSRESLLPNQIRREETSSICRPPQLAWNVSPYG